MLSTLFLFIRWDCVQKNNPSEWNHKVSDAMRKDFSWDAECCDVHLSAYTAIKSLWTKYKVERTNIIHIGHDIRIRRARNCSSVVELDSSFPVHNVQGFGF